MVGQSLLYTAFKYMVRRKLEVRWCDKCACMNARLAVGMIVAVVECVDFHVRVLMLLSLKCESWVGFFSHSGSSLCV
jgi:hypothetical protein